MILIAEDAEAEIARKQYEKLTLEEKERYRRRAIEAGRKAQRELLRKRREEEAPQEAPPRKTCPFTGKLCLGRGCQLWIEITRTLRHNLTWEYKGCGLIRVIPWKVEKTRLSRGPE